MPMTADTDALDLDMIGVLEGTDKSSAVSNAWDYLRHYQDLFAPWRRAAINLIEIGVENGPSLNVWRAYFERAQIIGLDINPACAALAGDRVAIEIGSQDDPGFLFDICRRYPPTIVIDDGSHLPEHIVFSLEQIFPALAPGGVYVIEDTELHAERHQGRWSGNGSVDLHDYLHRLARARLDNSAGDAGFAPLPRYIAQHLDQLCFIGGAAVLRKRAPRDTQAALRYAECYMAGRAPRPEHYARLAEYLLRHDGSVDQAVELAREAARGDAPTQAATHTLIRALERQGDLEGAAEVARRATGQWPEQSLFWHHLGVLQRRRRLPDAAAGAFRAAILLQPGIAYMHHDLSGALRDAGDLDGALAAAREAAALSAGSDAHARYAADADALARRLTVAATPA